MLDCELLDADDIPVVGSSQPTLVRSESDRYRIYETMQGAARRALAVKRHTIWVQPLTLETAHPSHRQPAGRVGLVKLANQAGADIHFVQLDAPDEVLMSRLHSRVRQSRTGTAWDVVLRKMRLAWQPIIQPHLRVCTQKHVEPRELLQAIIQPSTTLSPS